MIPSTLRLSLLGVILFPVFARAKLAAKMTVDLSNLKETGLATIMYASDHEDRYPLATPGDGHGGYLWGWAEEIPWDLRGGQSPLYYEQNRVMWGCSIQPYLKGFDLLLSPVGRAVYSREAFGDQDLEWVRKPGASSYAMNGLLEQYPSSSIARPSQLIAFGAPFGGTAILGGDFAQPFLACAVANEPCVYAPPKGDCGLGGNGELSGTWSWPEAGLDLRPSAGNGSNFAYADGSAKFRRMAANVHGKTDYRTDPYTQYDSQGTARSAWYDPQYCHPLLFRPDFDFQDYGNPVEG